MSIDNEWVVMGRFGRPHGIKGAITIVSFSEPREAVLDYQNWHVRNKTQWVPVKRLSQQVFHNVIVATIEGYPEREDVASLTNMDIAVARSQLPVLRNNDYYWHQLIGLRAITEQGYELGLVTEIMPTGSNDVLVVQGEKRHLIPYFLGESIVNVDLAEQTIVINWPCDL